MSAWLLTPEHLARLAISWGQYNHDTRYSSRMDQRQAALKAAAQMAYTNWESYYHRYSHLDTPCDDAFFDYLMMTLGFTDRMNVDPKLGWRDLYKMVGCYAYQSCEDQKLWDGERSRSKTFRQEHCNELQDAIIDALAGLDDATYAYSTSEPDPDHPNINDKEIKEAINSIGVTVAWESA